MTLTEDQFDWDAFHRDTRELSLEARGAWWDCLYKMRLSSTRGRITMPLGSFSILFGKSGQVTQRVLSEIGMLQVGEVVTDANGIVTVTNRRMYRRYLELESNRNRQSAFRERLKEPEHNGNITNGHKSDTVLVEERKLNNKEDKKQKKSRIQSSRIPDPFPLTDEMISWATTNLPGLNLIAAHDNFVEYWTNNTTAKASKVNWRLTWEKGMKLAYGWQTKDTATRVEVGKHDPEMPEIHTDCKTCFDFKTVTRFPNPNSIEGAETTDCPDCAGALAT